jgi:hypothetical protein
VGKTALAISVAAACSQDFPGGVTIVWLGSLRSADLVAAEVAAQLELPRLGGQSYEEALSRWLSERDVLLVIDNCEHVVSAVADLASGLTARLPRLRVLATSREPLWIDGEVTYRLAPLAVVAADASLEERHIAFNGRSVHVPDMKGLWHLRELVARPCSPVLALSLIAAPSEEPLPLGDAGPLLDREALRQYRKRLSDLDEELDDAEAKHDVARHAKRSAERDALLKELSRATGLGGKPRRTGSPAEKARLNVTRTIRHAIASLATELPELAAHLDESVATGISCCYEPRSNILWST